jgi:hypothetical protein
MAMIAYQYGIIFLNIFPMFCLVLSVVIFSLVNFSHSQGL